MSQQAEAGGAKWFEFASSGLGGLVIGLAYASVWSCPPNPLLGPFGQPAPTAPVEWHWSMLEQPWAGCSPAVPWLHEQWAPWVIAALGAGVIYIVIMGFEVFSRRNRTKS